MSDGPPAELLRAAQNTPLPQASEDKLQKLRKAVAEVRDLEKVKADQEEALKATNVALYEQYFKHLPDLLDGVGVPSIELAPEGNMPGVVAKVEPYYKANISADWEPEKRQDAFTWLDTNGHGDLIKTEVIVSFNRDMRGDALKFAEEQRAAGYSVTTKENVPWATLTSWLKEMVEKHKIMPPLETLGATVGRVVKLKPTKD